MSTFLEQTAHRPDPLPARPWAMRMRWHDLLFAHWPIDARQLAALLPAGLEVDTFAGQAWVGVVPFRMSGVRARLLPSIPGAHRFPELNVRTYVRRGERQGVWFFSLDAHSALAVWAARAWYGLPYFRSRMSCERVGEEIHYRAARCHRGAPAAEFVGRYRPTGPVEFARPGTLEYFLAERYALFTRDRRGQLRRADIHHVPWPLQPAVLEYETCTLLAARGLESGGGAPHLLFARELEVVAWSPEPA